MTASPGSRRPGHSARAAPLQLILRVFYFTLCCGKWRTLRPGSAGLGFYQVGNLRSHFPIRRFPFKVADPRIDSTRLLRVSVMSLRLRKKPPAPSLQRRRQLEITVLAHNQALHYLANHPLTEDERAQLTEVVHGYTGPCDVVAAREGLAWLRERYRERGGRAPY